MRVRAYRYRAYSSKTTAKLKTQLEVACKLYNTLLHAEEEYERNKHSMNKTEASTARLRPEKEEQRVSGAAFAGYPAGCGEVLPGAYEVFRRISKQTQEKEASQVSVPSVSSIGWRLSDTREVGQAKNKKKRKDRLYLSKIGFFTLILHRVFPENWVSQVCVKLYPSGRIYVIFLVEEPEAEELQSSKDEPKNAVGVDLGITRLVTLQMGASSRTLGLLSAFERIRVQRTLSRKRFLSKNWLKTKRKLAKDTNVLRISGVTLQTWGFTFTGVRCAGARGFKRSGFDPERRDKEEEDRLYDSSFSELRAVWSGSL